MDNQWDPTEHGRPYHYGCISGSRTIRRGFALQNTTICYTLILLILLLYASCTEKLPPGFLGSGTIEATEVIISPLITGQIIELTKDEGDLVKSGEHLASLDVEKLSLQQPQLLASIEEIKANKRSIKASFDQASDNLKNIESQYKRIQSLYDDKIATKEQIDDISTKMNIAKSQLDLIDAQKSSLEAKLKQLEASIALLERQIKDGKIESPLDGIVVEKYAELGEVMSAGASIFKIADQNQFWVKIYLAEGDLGIVKLGDEVKVLVDAYKDPIKGKISWVSSQAEFTPKNAQTRQARAELVYAIKVIIDNPPAELKIGMPTEVYLKDTP
ncbi:efflux RND transporter periplasmic adaptor subunit [bacterium]|nr:efflux RND transporter periplasmic adaptor subunit [bacterium]